MIFRKPYAFLIKNFKKIHLVLILLCAYIFYKHLQVYNFVKEYVDLEAYSAFLEPIDDYTNLLSYLSILLVIVIALLLLITLRRKEKPWKLYLVIIGEYLLMLFAFGMTTNFFHTYDDSTAVTQILMIRDLLLLASFAQYVVFLILFIRFTGLDLNKFSFQTDQEYLEMDSSDREEVEVSIEFDKHTIKRNLRKLKRNLGYFYLEHQFILNALASFLVVILIGYSYYYFGILHKVYKEGQVLHASGYGITIKNAYVSDKNYRGEVLDGDHYIILDLHIENNGGDRVLNTDRFHLMNRNYDILSSNLYDTEFNDLGTPYSKLELKNGRDYDFLLIFKADSKLDVNKFNLYYQEYSANDTYLRKIKLKLQDLRKIEATPAVSINQKQEMQVAGKQVEMTFNAMYVGDYANYNYYTCERSGCFNTVGEVRAVGAQKLIALPFTSLDFTGEEFIDFCEKFGTIKYKDSSGKTKEIPVKNALTKKALDKSLFLVVPVEIESSSSVELVLTIRTHRYTFKLR